jgi:hypothetical protein
LGSDVTADMVADPSSICGWNPDMYGVRKSEAGQKYYDSIIELYASWGVDYIKCDDICNTNLYRERQYSARHEIEMLHKAIVKCGRPIVLSLSPGPALIEEAWHYEKYANMWRITDDFWDNWDTLNYMFDRCEKWQNHVSCGCYPDCDMLPLGKVGKHFNAERDCLFTKEEQKTMMSLWCIFGSPLMLGAEMTQMDEWTVSLLTNEKLLNLLNGDFISKQVYRDKKKCAWCSVNPKTQENYVAIFNLTNETHAVEVSVEECASMYQDGVFPAICKEAVEIWSNETYDPNANLFKGELPPHGVKLIRRF